MKNRKVPEGSLQHIYKRSFDGGVIFYRDIDHLVYYTIQSVMARRHNLPVLCTVHMYTHVHKLVAAVDPLQLVRYEHDVNLVHTREYNQEFGRTGRLYRGPFGCASKRSDKDKRSSLIYVMNNPVEKRLCSRALENRWTFLAYYEQDYPFAERPDLKICRWALRNAFRVVDQEYFGGRHLKYTLLHRLYATMANKEKEQLTDYIIQRYFFFDKEACYRLFGDWEKMVMAIDMTKGKEFDVGEEYDPSSDIPYREMCVAVDRYGLLASKMPLLHLQEERREKLVGFIKYNTSGTASQIAKFMHYGLDKGKR